MGPENTDCEELDSMRLSLKALRQEIPQRTFRVQEELRISQYSTPSKFQYRSCDGQTGYLLTYHKDSVVYLYKNVPISTWQGLTDAEDPREYYRTLKNSLDRLKE